MGAVPSLDNCSITHAPLNYFSVGRRVAIYNASIVLDAGWGGGGGGAMPTKKYAGLGGGGGGLSPSAPMCSTP